MPSDIYANPNEFVSRQLDFDFFLKGISIEDSLLAFFVEDKKIRGFSAVSGTKAVKAFRYESWLLDLMDYKDGIIYSVINGRNIEANKRLFKGYDLDSLRGLSNNIVLKFRYKGANL